MFFNIAIFVLGMIVGPTALLILAAKFKKQPAPSEPLRPTREELIQCVEFLRDRLRHIEASSGQRVISELARRAQDKAASTLQGDIDAAA